MRKPNKSRVCSVQGCDRPHYALGFCAAHRARFLKSGDPGPAELKRWVRNTVCEVGGCEQPARWRQMCARHASRWDRNGDPLIRSLEPHGPRWRGDEAGYNAVHARLRETNGNANLRACVACGGPADEWAYDHSDLDERVDDAGRPFSLNPNHYQPMCKPCHRGFDATRTHAVCTADGCDAPHKARGLCNRHYQRAWKAGR